ncbi:MAG: hypothetical protein HY701_09170 [Gemmatimonadetes bacterium]|nr:hypothetical protein [Gemmatimonadota bacterium]
MSRLARGLALGAVGAVVFAAACDQGPSGPGALTATVVSPHGPEGAAVVSVTGETLGAVSAAGATQVFTSRNGAETRILLVNLTPGELRFRLEVPDLGAPTPPAVVLHVAGGDNVPRPIVSAYSVRFSR